MTPVMFLDSCGCSTWSDFWNGVGNWFEDHWLEIVIGTAFIVGGALLSSTVQVSASIAIGVVVNGVVNLSNGNEFFENVGGHDCIIFYVGRNIFGRISNA